MLPAFSHAPEAQPPPLPDAAAPLPGEAVCFYNPALRATCACSHCGVFISDAWSAQWGTETVCLKCLEELRKRRKDARFESRRVLWDNIALLTALLPFLSCIPLLLLGPVGIALMLLCVMVSLVTAPLAVGLAIYAWKKPRSLVPRGPWRVAWALALALLQCIAWGAVIISGVSRTLLG